MRRIGSYCGLTGLDVAAVHGRVDLELAYWYVARALDAEGSGRVPVGALRDALGSVASATLRRALRKGALVGFWSLGRQTVWLAKPGRLAPALGAEGSGVAYEASLAYLDAPRGERRARMVLNAFSLERAGRPISVAAMAEACAVTLRTMFRWIRLTKWGRTVNVALLERVKDDSPSGPGGVSLRGRLALVREGNEVWIAERLPNSLVDHRGVTRLKVTAALRQAKASLACNLGERGQRQSLYAPGQGRRPSRSYRLRTLRATRSVTLWVPDDAIRNVTRSRGSLEGD